MAKVIQHPSAREDATPPARLTAAHDTEPFQCGQPQLDDWIKTKALESDGRTARTYVVCDKLNIVVGYYCISAGSVERSALPPRMKRQQGQPNPIPIAIIGRLARHSDAEWKGLGSDLLHDALTRIASAAEIIGVRAVLVHALDDTAAAFWKKHGFIECPLGSKIFYLPLDTIAEAMV